MIIPNLGKRSNPSGVDSFCFKHFRYFLMAETAETIGREREVVEDKESFNLVKTILSNLLLSPSAVGVGV
jgi:hypothetical protein